MGSKTLQRTTTKKRERMRTRREGIGAERQQKQRHMIAVGREAGKELRNSFVCGRENKLALMGGWWWSAHPLAHGDRGSLSLHRGSSRTSRSSFVRGVIPKRGPLMV